MEELNTNLKALKTKGYSFTTDDFIDTQITDTLEQDKNNTSSTSITQEDENDTRTKGIKKSLNINIRDLSYKNQKLYDSTFLSFSYAQKKNEEFKNLDTFTKLSPPKEELDKCNSRFYNKINQ